MANIKKITPTCIWCSQPLRPNFIETRVESSKSITGFKYKKEGIKEFGLHNQICSKTCGTQLSKHLIEGHTDLATARKRYYLNLVDAHKGTVQRGFNGDKFRKAAERYGTKYSLEVFGM